jgi:hypothetical protein
LGTKEIGGRFRGRRQVHEQEPKSPADWSCLVLLPRTARDPGTGLLNRA